VNPHGPIVLFDGVCNFCNYWVKFAVKHDRKKKLKFAPLQGETAKRVLSQHHLDPTSLSSVILVDKGKAYTQSSAAILYGLIIIPKTLRDFLYNIIARNRYRWFGKKETCMIPPPGWKERFPD